MAITNSLLESVWAASVETGRFARFGATAQVVTAFGDNDTLQTFPSGCQPRVRNTISLTSTSLISPPRVFHRLQPCSGLVPTTPLVSLPRMKLLKNVPSVSYHQVFPPPPTNPFHPLNVHKIVPQPLRLYLIKLHVLRLRQQASILLNPR